MHVHACVCTCVPEGDRHTRFFRRLADPAPSTPVSSVRPEACTLYPALCIVVAVTVLPADA